MTADNQDGRLSEIPLDSNNFVLRGCSLKNTEFVYGLVLYTGHDTKIMLNTVQNSSKIIIIKIINCIYIFRLNKFLSIVQLRNKWINA